MLNGILVKTGIGGDVMGILLDAFERMTKAVELRGETRGIAIGKVRGAAKGRAEVLSDALQYKFGPLPEQYRERIVAARRREIKQWLQRSYDESSLDRVFNGRNKG